MARKWPSKVGCRIAGLTAVAISFAVAGCGGTGVSGPGPDSGYAMNGIAYKTYTAGIDRVHDAVLVSMGRMGMTVREDAATGSGRRIAASAVERNIEIELEQLADNSTRMRVEVGRGLLPDDRATAAEIVAQTGLTLDDRLEKNTNDKAEAMAG